HAVGGGLGRWPERGRRPHACLPHRATEGPTGARSVTPANRDGDAPLGAYWGPATVIWGEAARSSGERSRREVDVRYGLSSAGAARVMRYVTLPPPHQCAAVR